MIDLGGQNTTAWDINNVGQIVGTSSMSDPNGPQHAFLWENDVMTDLGTLGGNHSYGLGINDVGKIVGNSQTAGGLYHAFLWQDGVMTDLGTLGGAFSAAYAINNSDQIVGTSTNSFGQPRAFLWQNGVMTDLGALDGNIDSTAENINNAGQVVGISGNPNPDRAFLWQNGMMTNLGVLPNYTGSHAASINSQGSIVGYSFGYPAGRAVLWENGVIKNLGAFMPYLQSEATSINDGNQVVGWSDLSSSGQIRHAFIWENNHMYDLGVPNNTSYIIASNINNNGQVVGYWNSSVNGLYHAFLITPQVSTDIKANGSDGPITVPYNSQAEISITWSSEYTHSCQISPLGRNELSGHQPLFGLTASETYTIECVGLGGTASDSVTVNVLPPQITSLNPAQVWVGLKNSDDVGVKFDLRAEAYKDNTLVSSGELNSFPGGSSGFNNAHLATIPFDSFSPPNFPPGSQLKLVIYVRNACTSSGHNSGTARLWYNDSAANSQFGSTVGGTTNTDYLLYGFVLGTSAGSGPKKTVDVAAGTRCSAFKSFGTWTIAP